MSKFKIGDTVIGDGHPAYFIADIAANHDGSLEKAKELIWMAKEAGADAAKFQHFKSKTIVSEHGFNTLGKQLSHQSAWKKSVCEVYKDAEVPLDWTADLAQTCKQAGIDFFTTPYNFECIDEVDEYVPAYKIGSGDITHHDLIAEICKKNKPVMIATGASDLNDVISVISLLSKKTNDLVLMQCNTNYTASLENFRFINLSVLKTYGLLFPDVILGLSDHTPGHSTVLGAIALGAKVIEKHFTNDNDLVGPDHKFSMNPKSWREMVERSRELEAALGSPAKKIEDNEKETYIVQRRSLRLKYKMKKDQKLSRADIIALRPCTDNGLYPYEIEKLIGRTLSKDMEEGEELTQESFLV